MTSLLLRRLVILIPVLWGVATLVFSFLHLLPGDPVDIMLGETALPAARAEMRDALGLDRPLGVQYAAFLSGVVRGEWGDSFTYKEPVLTVIGERYGATLTLAAASLCVAVVLAIPLGLVAALRKDTPVDVGAMGFALLGVSIPNFWLGPMLIIAFAIQVPLFPVSGREGWSSLVLPAITLGTALAAILSRMTRAGFLDVLQHPYVRAADARGLTRWRVLMKHALRNALIPLVTVLGLQAGALLGGAIITEMVFSWPGIGRLLITAINARDYPLVQGCVLVIALTYVAVNLLVDVMYGYIDPRVRVRS